MKKTEQLYKIQFLSLDGVNWYDCTLSSFTKMNKAEADHQYNSIHDRGGMKKYYRIVKENNA